jgi:hypothetical protein
VGAAVFGVFLVVAIVAVIVAAASAAKEKRLRWLAAAADFLGGEHDRSSKAWGTKLGPKVTLEFATRGAGSSAESWTHIHVDIPPRYPLALHVRRHGRADHKAVARGEMVDVLVGDAAFDTAFLIEAAPADVVRVLLDAEIRSLLSAHQEIDLDTVERGDGTRALVLGMRGWLEDLASFAAPIQVMARLGGRVRDAYAAADAEVERGTAAGDPYRPVTDDEPARKAQAQREAEVSKVKGLRADRDARAKAIAAIVIGIVFAIIAFSVCATALSR